MQGTVGDKRITCCHIGLELSVVRRSAAAAWIVTIGRINSQAVGMEGLLFQNRFTKF